MDGIIYATCCRGAIISVAFTAMPIDLIVSDLEMHGASYVAARRRDAEEDICEHGWETYSEADVEREMIMNGWRARAKVSPRNRGEKWTVWEKS